MARTQDGHFFWYDILTTDVEATTAFYAEVVGWEVSVDASGQYPIARAHGRPVAGILPLGGEAQPHWLGQILTEDVGQLCRRLTFLQGEVLIPPEEIPDLGVGAMIADPVGAVLHAFTPHTAQDETFTPTRGAIGFHAMLAPRADLACRVYKTLFPWKVGKPQTNQAGTWTMLKDRTTPIAAALEWAQDDAPPQWVHYVIVDDVDETLVRAQSAGATVLHAPVTLRKVGTVATLVDPTGARFGIMSRLA
jgi:hypothetical protein